MRRLRELLCDLGGRGLDRDDQKFVAVEGLHAWATAILTQAERLELGAGTAVERQHVQESIPLRKALPLNRRQKADRLH